MRQELERLRLENSRLRAATTSQAIVPAGEASEVARLQAQVDALKAQVEILRSANVRRRANTGLTPLYPMGAADTEERFEAAPFDPIYGSWGPPPAQQFGQVKIWVGSWNMVCSLAAGTTDGSVDARAPCLLQLRVLHRSWVAAAASTPSPVAAVSSASRAPMCSSVRVPGSRGRPRPVEPTPVERSTLSCCGRAHAIPCERSPELQTPDVGSPYVAALKLTLLFREPPRRRWLLPRA